jgi:steroid delta-isomerase-like uncharacterized protein
MPVADPKALVRRCFAAVEAGDRDALADLLAPDYRLRFDGLPAMEREAAIGFFLGFRASFPDLHHAVEEQLADGDRVATRITVRGTHRGELQGIPPTGKAVAVAAINIHRLAGGEVVEQWVNSDGLGLMQQLGVLPPPDQG